MKKCAECGKKCEKPIAKVDMAFDYGKTMRLGASEWNDGKEYCGVPCLMRMLRRETYAVIKDGGEE